MITGRKHRPAAGNCLPKLIVLLVALLALAALGWMLLLPVFVTGQIRSRTGFDASVASLSCNPFTGRLSIRGLVLANPPTFPTSDFLELREFHAEGDLASLVAERIVLDELVLDVRLVSLVRRADGHSNAEVFEQNLGLIAAKPMPPAPSASVSQSGAGASPRPPNPGGAIEPAHPPGRKFLFRHLALRFDRLMLADYTGAKPDVREFQLGLDQHYQNVTSAEQILVPDVLRRFAADNLGPALSRLVPGDFGRALGETARDAAKSGEALLKDAGAQATDLLRGLREKLDQTKKP